MARVAIAIVLAVLLMGRFSDPTSLSHPTTASAVTSSVAVSGAPLHADPASTVSFEFTGSVPRFPDPAILATEHGYYAYSTRGPGGNIPVIWSHDLTYWSSPRDALPQLATWSEGRTWAPAVIKRGGKYVMWYTTRDRAAKRQCISVATADQPSGPFRDTSTAPAICQLDRAGSIDPEVFVAQDGAAYLHWKSEDNALGLTTALWGARLSPDGTQVGEYVHLLDASEGWQGRLIEGPAMIQIDGVYYLFYGANNWATQHAAIGYAICRGPLGPCEDTSRGAPWLSSAGQRLGPSGPAPFRDATGTLRLAYHAHDPCIGTRGCARSFYLATLALRDGRPDFIP